MFPGRQRKAVGGDASGRAVRRAVAVMSVLIRRGSAGYQLGAALAMESSYASEAVSNLDS